MQINTTVKEEPRAEESVPQPPRRRKRQAAINNGPTSSRVSRLLRQSIMGASMLPPQPKTEASNQEKCQQCQLRHRGPCPGIRSKSVFVRKGSMDSSSWICLDTVVRPTSFDISALNSRTGHFPLRASTIRPNNLDKNYVLPQQIRSELIDELQVQEETHEELCQPKNVDQGYAWVILTVVFIINATTFGTAEAYGLIFAQEARESGMSRTDAALPFTVMGAVENMAGPVCGCLLALTGSCRLTVILGSFLVALGHLLASFFNGSAIGQLLPIGLMTGFGLSFISISFFQITTAYFDRYRNLAFGVGMTGSALGTLVISPLCHHLLHHEGASMCYLVLSMIMAPNIPLGMLLKPRSSPSSKNNHSSGASISSDSSSTNDDGGGVSRKISAVSNVSTPTSAPSSVNLPNSVGEGNQEKQQQKHSQRRVQWVANKMESQEDSEVWNWLELVFVNPYFYLLWPTQVLFCWFNFVFGMITVDFAKDREMSDYDTTYLVPCWAFGHVFGHLLLGQLIDLKLISYRACTVICYSAIGIVIHLLNQTKVTPGACHCQSITIPALVFVLSSFIALWHVLLHDLVLHHVDRSLQTITMGISSYLTSFFLLPRAHIIGFFRDVPVGKRDSSGGNYDTLLDVFAYVALGAALVWLVVPPVYQLTMNITSRIKALFRKAPKESTRVSDNDLAARVGQNSL